MNLRQMREQLGLSQSELSAISGVNLRSLQDYEQGHKPVSSAKGETLLKLSLSLGYSIEDILKGNSAEMEAFSDDKVSRNERLLAYEKLLNSRKTSVFHFPIIEKDDFVDMSMIYPTKQSAVKRVLNSLRGDSLISELRIFGSSITMSCNRNSDIDFAVKLIGPSTSARNEISERIQIACDWNADIIWMDHVTSEDRIYKSIMKGMVLI